MSSEHTPPNVIRLTRPQSPPHGEPDPTSPSQEGDPFSSRQGSPHRYPSNIDTGTGNVLHASPNPHLSPSTSVEKHGDRDRESLVALQDNTGIGAGQPIPPLPVRLPEGGPSIRRQRTTDTRMSAARRSNIDWIVPIDEKDPLTRALTVGQRLQPTLDVAMAEKQKYETKARMTGYALNAAIGLQVLFGSLTTGLSAVATTGRSAAVQTTILGGLSTIVASYLARARGSNEPELSITRVKDLEQFIRECKSFQMDKGHVVGDEYDEELEAKRRRFEELLGNANGERRLSPV
ncbi:hypothetical protein M413DRAFT_167044 [Hebeloma cylindrosporum]|uniref:SMODS and SLOG-associating 2TM effector domain-containing protein n=1 Tax=Hebeloma cylindrosporum TaxID=76867 RepID=A0A0C2XSR0_HEBCY|nr:hypothetical protein M413DRAFT_167044 [Hebeloma cylindrosporum h7]